MSTLVEAPDVVQTIWVRTINGRPTLGGAAERTRRTSTRDVEMFSEMTGDRNPLHYDAELAAASPFGRMIVQGGITSGLLNAVATECRFLKAVGIGDEITARVEVTSVRDDKPICTLATTVRDASGAICLAGKAVTYTVPLRNRRSHV
jgi:acyl dehydratase